VPEFDEEATMSRVVQSEAVLERVSPDSQSFPGKEC